MNKPDDPIKEVDKFNEWMLKIQNRYYSYNQVHAINRKPCT